MPGPKPVYDATIYAGRRDTFNIVTRSRQHKVGNKRVCRINRRALVLLSVVSYPPVQGAVFTGLTGTPWKYLNKVTYQRTVAHPVRDEWFS